MTGSWPPIFSESILLCWLRTIHSEIGQYHLSSIEPSNQVTLINSFQRAKDLPVKKIDLHMHTVSTISDAAFEFSMESLQRYVDEASLDAIAITNHNVFELEQFERIKGAIGNCVVFPGIEIDLCNCHLLLIANTDAATEFSTKADSIRSLIQRETDSIDVAKLKEIFVDLNEYLLIPHYKKKPAISQSTLFQLSDFVCAGEVDSVKKFVRAINDGEQLTPVLFSDTRMSTDLADLPIRQTYIDCGELTLSAIKTCLKDKSKVALSASSGNSLFQVFPSGQMISTGLNVLLGERSSGKSYSLDQIEICHPNVKYVRQFSLVQKQEADDEKEFAADIERRRSNEAASYLQEFQAVIDDAMAVERDLNNRELGDYVETLLRSANEADRQDSFSSTAMFNETAFPVTNLESLKELIDAVRLLIETEEHRDLVVKHLELAALKSLACELIEKLRELDLLNRKKQYVNELIESNKERLKIKSSAVQIKDADFYRIALDQKKIDRFNRVGRDLKKPGTVDSHELQGYRLVVKKGVFNGAGEVKKASGTNLAFREAMEEYDSPFEYLQHLKNNEDLANAVIYKLFAKISYQIFNKHGFPVSGGERSEFRLLREIKDAQNFDMLLIDEPESSFDNMFLHGDVNELLKDMAKTMPVVVVTHNSTVGASIQADYLLYAQKFIDENGIVSYKIYSGHPTDKQLAALDGDTIETHSIMMSSLEAGQEAYDERKEGYEALKN